LATSAAAAVQATDLLTDLGLHTVDWVEARAYMLGDPSSPFSAMLAVDTDEPHGDWLFDAGLALGALRERALIVLLDGARLPAGLPEGRALQYDPAIPGAEAAVAAALKRGRA
ncbi:MAG TPA: hypothetical protein VMT89_05630, partial [Candidatus Acidoferrales bacterium]|nr:hypothetical protein [Candidatus Acidoferrales bacterium]